MRSAYWLAVTVLLMVVGYGLLRPDTTPTSLPPATQQPALARPVPAPQTAPAAQPAAAVRPAQSQLPQLADLSRRHALAAEMSRTQDLLAFVRAHLAEAKGGDGEAQYALAQALSACASMEQAKLPDGRLVRDVLGDNSVTEQQRRMAQGVASRCDALDQAKGEVGTALDWYQQADRSGVGAAMLQEAEEPAFGAAEARVAKLRQALASGDPAVVMALVQSSDRWTGSRDALETEDANHVFAARDLTECALGYDCSTAGPIYQTSCRRSECEHADTVQRSYELSMNPQEYAAVQDYAATLAANIRGGDDGWPEAQKLEQQIRDVDTAQAQ
jgi:hypothetical protein